MLGDTRGRSAGLGIDELLRFLPCFKVLASPLDPKPVEEAGLGGTGVELETSGVISPPACVVIVDVNWSFMPRVSMFRNIGLDSIAAGGNEISFIVGSAFCVDAVWPYLFTAGFAIFMREAGVAGSFAGCEVTDCEAFSGPRYGDFLEEPGRGVAGGGIISDKYSGEIDPDSEVV